LGQNFMEILLQNIKSLFEVKESVNGKVDLQKSFYFMKELGMQIPFNFRWSKLGPYSYELSNVVERLINQGYLNYRGFFLLDDDVFTGFEVSYPPKLGVFFDELNDICEEKSYNEVYFIECAASLHFIYKYSNIMEKESAFIRLHDLKPQRIELLSPYMEDSWTFLTNQGLIT